MDKKGQRQGLIPYMQARFEDVWASIVRHGPPDTNRNRAEIMNWNILLHLLPVRIHQHSLSFKTTFGLGMISLYLFFILSVSGVILMFYYVPSVEEAYGRMKDLEYVVSYGMVIRNLHRWTAHGMVFFVFFHMCRVFYTASYKKPREFNWGAGVILLVLTLGLSFTGYLLPWDQLAFWAITVGSSIAGYAPLIGEKFKFVLLGSNEVGQEALIRFYVLHVVILPAAAIALLALHFWRVRKDGGLARLPEYAEMRPEKNVSPEPFRDPDKTYGLMAVMSGNAITARVRTPDNTLSSWPHLVYRLFVLLIAVSAVFLIASVYFDAPLKEIANPRFPENPAKAPWYFLGLQELVSYSALVGGVLIPAFAVIGLLAIPYFDREQGGEGAWLRLPGNKTAIAWSAAFSLAACVGLLAISIKTGGLRGMWPTVPRVILDIVNPGTLLVGFMGALAGIEWKRTASMRNVMIVLFTSFVVINVVLIIIGVYLRGPSWDFYWFWEEWPGH